MGCGACSTGWAGQMPPSSGNGRRHYRPHFWDLMFDVEALEKRTG